MEHNFLKIFDSDSSGSAHEMVRDWGLYSNHYNSYWSNSASDVYQQYHCYQQQDLGAPPYKSAPPVYSADGNCRKKLSDAFMRLAGSSAYRYTVNTLPYTSNPRN